MTAWLLKVAIACVVGVAAMLGNTAAASACTCLAVDLETALPRADGAFIGTLLERRGPQPQPIQSSGDPITLVFRVEQVYRGDIENRIEVVTARDGASCGIEAAVGDRVGLLLDRQGDTWHGNLCGRVEPSAFLALTDVDDNALPEINWGGYVVGTLVLAAGAFFLVRRLRRR